MKVLVSWLREFVDVAAAPEDIAATMSVRGFAVESLERVGVDDAVLDFEVTANRPDCMSVIGMAREVATAYGLPLRTAEADTVADAQIAAIDVGIEAPELCARYVGAVAEVDVRPAPEWMQQRLRAAGVRPISNIVDVTNYVLLEMGQPMHAFDLERLAGCRIRVRTAREGEKLRTLDGQMRELTPEMLVIADAGKPVAVAGVMGGADSEVSTNTRTIVLESAYFNPQSVRRTSRVLGLKTEASMRFERGADPAVCAAAMRRAIQLLHTVGAMRAHGPIVDCHPVRIEPVRLRLRRDRIAGLLGASIPDPDVQRILESLGFTLTGVDDGWQVTVPTRRVDVRREVDLIEEVARHYGFDRIPVTFPAVVAAPPQLDPRVVRSRQLRSVMTGAGFSEAVTFGFIGAEAATPFAAEGDLVPIANPLSENFAVLRPSVLPGLLDAVAHNRRREQRDVRLFEMGNRFSRVSGERRALGIAWTGIVGDHWSGGSRAVDFFDIKGVVERVCDALRVEGTVQPETERWLVPGRSAAVVANGLRVGVLGQLAADVAGAHGLPADPVYVAEIDLDAVDATAVRGDVRYESLPRFPSVTRDISILVDEALPSASVRDTVREGAPQTLARVREFDRYQGKGVPEGKVSVSLRLTFRSPDRTLTDAEVQDAMTRIVSALVEGHGAIQR